MLHRQLVERADRPLPPAASDAARRTLLNVLSTAVGASRSDAVDILLATACAQGGTGAVVIPGRTETTDPHWGALTIGTAAHLDDFDDTHLETVIHPGAAVLATLLALQPEVRADGASHLAAFALGCELQLRVGLAISPSHYDRGWHITGTCGVFAAAAAAGLLLGLDAEALEQALGFASVTVLGHREAFGSMTKPLHPGKAAANGIIAARLAATGLRSSIGLLDERSPLVALADAIDERPLRDWAGSWELERNTFKPYPCGIVAHPLIDAATEASEQLGGGAGSGGLPAIVAVRVRCNPLVPELMGLRQPLDGLQARFSAYHATAVGLLDGEAGLAQFGDARATAADARALCDLIELEPTDACPRDAAALSVRLEGGEVVAVEVAHARGSLDRPLTDAELLDKAERLIAPILGSGVAVALAGAVARLAGAADLTEVLALLRPGGDR